MHSSAYLAFKNFISDLDAVLYEPSCPQNLPIESQCLTHVFQDSSHISQWRIRDCQKELSYQSSVTSLLTKTGVKIALDPSLDGLMVQRLRPKY